MEENEENQNKTEESTLEIKRGDLNRTKGEFTTKTDEIPSVDEESNLEKKIKELENQIENKNQKLVFYEDKLKRSLADFQNLEKKTKADIEKGVRDRMDQFMKKFLIIYDDFILAKKTLSEQKINVDGLNAIVKNLNSFLNENEIKPIEALGEIFDPNFHEAISVKEDSNLDDGTIIKEIRKGYISQNRVIRPTIVEISKKPKQEKFEGE